MNISSSISDDEPKSPSSTITAVDIPSPPPQQNPFQHLPPGYPRLAAQMEVMPSAAIFRRFGALNARNILYFQSELTALENDLMQLEAEDHCDETGRKKLYAASYYWLHSANKLYDGQPRDGDTRQRDLVLHMRELLREYNHALIQQSAILRLKEPDPFDLRYIQNALSSDELGAHALCGQDHNTWGSVADRKSHSPELVSLKERAGTDAFSRWLGNKAIDWLQMCGCLRFMKIDPRFGAASLHDATIFRATFLLTNAIASSLPVLGILVLMILEDPFHRLAAIAGFCVLVNVCLTVFTDAKRTDVFEITAAFAAVLVVFMGQAQGALPAVGSVGGSNNTTISCG